MLLSLKNIWNPAYLLHVSEPAQAKTFPLMCSGDDDNRRKGQVLTLLAEQALKCLDFKASYIHCQDLMGAGL